MLWTMPASLSYIHYTTNITVVSIDKSVVLSFKLSEILLLLNYNINNNIIIMNSFLDKKFLSKAIFRCY